MTTSESCDAATSTSLDTAAKAALLLNTGLAGLLFGYGFMGMDDSSWIEISVEVIVPILLLLSVGYVLIDGSR
jgi:hypothetical protein